MTCSSPSSSACGMKSIFYESLIITYSLIAFCFSTDKQRILKHRSLPYEELLILHMVISEREHVLKKLWISRLQWGQRNLVYQRWDAVIAFIACGVCQFASVVFFKEALGFLLPSGDLCSHLANQPFYLDSVSSEWLLGFPHCFWVWLRFSAMLDPGSVLFTKIQKYPAL